MADTKGIAPIADPCCLLPADVEGKCETVGCGKANLGFTSMFMLAIFAGMFIAIGGTFFSVVMGDASLGLAAKKLLGGLVFCVGLVLVLTCGAELFTGNTLMVQAALAKRITVTQLLRNWGVVFVGNCIGSLLIVALVVGAQMYNLYPDQAIGDAMAGVAAGKINLDYGVIVIRGILANMFVCLAVWIGFAGKTVTDKILGTLFPITAFVACGFEHVVANMFFLPYGYALKLLGMGSDVAGIENVDIAGILYNISGALIGNIIGGAVLIGVFYYIALHKKES